MSQLYEIDSQGNKKIISGMVTGELPKYTMAEYTALTDKPQYWECTDYDATSEYGVKATEVNSVSVLSIPANTYNTWALALQAIYTEFNKLTAEQKRKSKIIRNDEIVFKCSALSGAFEATYAGSATKVIIQNFYLSSGIFLNTEMESSTISTTSRASESQSQKLEFIIGV